jgi:pyrroline-5-carboxylate reductase
MTADVTPILMKGAGRMGGAMIAGWERAKAFSERELMILDPFPGDVALAAARAGALLNPPDEAIGGAKTVVLAIKPQQWREAVGELAPHLSPDAVVVSIVAGLAAGDIAAALQRPVARVMPTQGAAIGQGTASIYAADPAARARAHALFDPIGVSIDLADEDQMHAATALSGSSPAYLYAFIEALEAAGPGVGLTPEQSRLLARSTIAGAAALLHDSGEDPAHLRDQVTSKGGTTAAALSVLIPGLGPLLDAAVKVATERSRELGK